MNFTFHCRDVVNWCFKQCLAQKISYHVFLSEGSKDNLSFFPTHSRLCSMAILVVEFSSGGTKLERFLPKNHHTQMKLLNFESWVNGEVSKSAKI